MHHSWPQLESIIAASSKARMKDTRTEKKAFKLLLKEIYKMGITYRNGEEVDDSLASNVLYIENIKLIGWRSAAVIHPLSSYYSGLVYIYILPFTVYTALSSVLFSISLCNRLYSTLYSIHFVSFSFSFLFFFFSYSFPTLFRLRGRASAIYKLLRSARFLYFLRYPIV